VLSSCGAAHDRSPRSPSGRQGRPSRPVRASEYAPRHVTLSIRSGRYPRSTGESRPDRHGPPPTAPPCGAPPTRSADHCRPVAAHAGRRQDQRIDSVRANRQFAGARRSPSCHLRPPRSLTQLRQAGVSRRWSGMAGGRDVRTGIRKRQRSGSGRPHVNRTSAHPRYISPGQPIRPAPEQRNRPRSTAVPTTAGVVALGW
jgi:hypothetical protein